MKRSIGIDLGGTMVRAALVEDGVVIANSATKTDVAGGPNAVLAQFDKLIEKIGGLHSAQTIGISAPGPLNTKTGRVLHIPTLPGWEGFELRDIFSRKSGLPVTLENDGIAATYGEWIYGAGRGLDHMVYVTVSTGIGGGAVVDGHLLRGRKGMAAHVGHFPMTTDGPECSCGSIGCFEALASGTALVRDANIGLKTRSESTLASLDTVDGASIVDAARSGDLFAQELLSREARLLGLGFAGLVHLYSPQRIVIGGGISNAFDLLKENIQSTLNKRIMDGFRPMEVVKTELGGNAGLIGVATLSAENYDHTV